MLAIKIVLVALAVLLVLERLKVPYMMVEFSWHFSMSRDGGASIRKSLKDAWKFTCFRPGAY